MHKFAGQQGSALIYQPLLLKLATLVLVLLFISVILIVSFTDYKTTVAVRGNLAPLDGTIKVYSNQPGRLKEILVREGQRVQQGEVLAVISHTQYDRAGVAKTQLLLAQMQTEQRFLKQQLDLSIQLQNRAEEQHQLAVDGLHNSIALLEQELSLLNEQLQLSDENLAAQAAVLEQQGISRIQFNQYQAGHMSLLQQRQDLQLRVHAMHNQLTELHGQESSSGLQFRQKQLQLQSQVDQLDYRYRQIESEQSETLVASADGTVTAITAVTGQISDSRQPLMYINTADTGVEALLYVPSSAIGSIEPERTVLLEYDAYSQQSYGNYKAVITSISQTSIDPRQHLLPITTLQEPVYLVKAALAQQFVSGPETHQVQPGMLFTADIVTDDRTILQHIFDPITRLKRKT